MLLVDHSSYLEDTKASPIANKFVARCYLLSIKTAPLFIITRMLLSRGGLSINQSITIHIYINNLSANLKKNFSDTTELWLSAA